MVLDIEKYPEFVPWCLEAKILNKNDKGDKNEITADLEDQGRTVYKFGFAHSPFPVPETVIDE